MKLFRKRVFTISTFFKDTHSLYVRFGSLKKAFIRKNIDSSFRERIMLAVTQVNKCKFCSFGHTKAALSTGISSKEINEILDANFQNVPDVQKLALCFAQSYAEMGGLYEQEYLNKLTEYYGSETARDILAYTQFMAYCNLCGNTIEGLLLRFIGKKIPGSAVYDEIIVVLSMIIVIPLLLILGILFK